VWERGGVGGGGGGLEEGEGKRVLSRRGRHRQKGRSGNVLSARRHPQWHGAGLGVKTTIWGAFPWEKVNENLGGKVLLSEGDEHQRGT